VPKDFDSDFDQDLSFKIGGEEFQMRWVRPEVLASWDEETDTDKTEDALKRIDSRIMAFLANDENRDRWTKLRANEEVSLPLVKINELLTWMVEVQTSRPTTQPSPSGGGRGRTAVPSKAG
jgi:hypothetical protein